jgi:Zn-dependent protease
MLEWSFPLYRLWGIQVRLHYFWPIMAAAQLYSSLRDHYLHYAAAGLVIMLVQVLVHEYGHCWASRRVGGQAETILIWPLGGLSFVSGGESAKDHMFVAVMGPVTNMLFIVFPAIALAALGLWRWEFLDPLNAWIVGSAPFWQNLILMTFKIGFILTLFNLLVPAYPLDGGRILLVWLADRYGRERGTRVSLYFSIPVGVAMCVWAISTEKTELLLLLIGLSVLFEAWQLFRLAQMGALDQHPAFPAQSGWMDYGARQGRDEEPPGFLARWRQKRRLKEDRQRTEGDALLKLKVDAVLEKVSREGIGSLTPEERRVLDDASKKLRGE